MTASSPALAGGWLGDYLLPRMKSSYYLVSAASMALGMPVMIVALFVKGPADDPGDRGRGILPSVQYRAAERGRHQFGRARIFARQRWR